MLVILSNSVAYDKDLKVDLVENCSDIKSKLVTSFSRKDRYICVFI